MNQQFKPLCRMCLAFAGLLLISSVNAQTFTYKQTDLYLGFRTASTLSNQAVVNIGSATNYMNLPAGSSNAVTGYSPSQLFPDSFNLNNLSWSVGADVKTGSVPGYPLDTIWVTSPRSDPNVQTAPPHRWDQGSLSGVVYQIESVLLGASQISTRISAGADNTATFVREPGPTTGNVSQSQTYYDYVASQQTGLGTYRDTWYDENFLPLNVENTTPASFTSPVRSDLYEVRPDGFADTYTGQSSGNAYYVGYFQFNTNGTMSFFRASANQTPPAPRLNVSRNGSTTTVSFTSNNGTTYTLYYSDNLTTPFASWTAAPGTITGNGTTKSFTDTTASSTRFYRVSAQ